MDLVLHYNLSDTLLSQSSVCLFKTTRSAIIPMGASVISDVFAKAAIYLFIYLFFGPEYTFTTLTNSKHMWWI